VSSNPYAPPAQPSSIPSSAGPRLFGAGGIALDVIFLHPLVGAVLAAINHRRLGDDAAFRRMVSWFVVPSALLFLATLLFSSLVRQAQFASTVLLLLMKVIVAWLLYREHAPLVKRHLENGGEKVRFSFWWFLLILFGVLLYLAVWQFLSPTPPTHRT